MIQQEPSISGPESNLGRAQAVDQDGRNGGDGLFDVLTLLARRKQLIAAVMGIATLIGAILSLVLPVRYTATTRIMTPQQTQSTSSLLMSQLVNSGAGALAAVAGGGLGLKNPNDIYIGLLRSRPVADAIIHEFGLQALYRAKDMTTARQILAINTVVESEKSGFLAVSVTDRDKKRAAEIANAYTEQLRVLTKTLAVTEASQRRLFYEEQLKLAKEDLISAELSLQKIEQQKGLVQLDAQSRGLITSLTELHAQAAAKQVELDALRSYSTDNNPEVQLAEKQLASLQGEAIRLEQRGHSSSPADMGLQDMAGAGMEYLSAEHELQYRQTLFDLLVRQFDAAKLDEAKEAAVIQVVETATPPDQRSSPHRTAMTLTFAGLGFLGACSYLFVCNFVRTNPEVSRRLIQFASALFGK
jgi:uncharacterized protein involved in exopolysaccharide biosynthesis